MVKLFAHRGFVEKNILENSLDALKNAYNKGFRAIEFDIWFLNDELILSHGHPQSIINLTKFEDYFLYKNDMEYWMDFKNLDESNADEILRLVQKTIEEKKINLNKIYFAPFITNYAIARVIFQKIYLIFGNKVKIMAVCESIKNQEEALVLKEFLEENNIKFLSIFHELVDEKLIRLLSKTQFFTWTVNDIERVKKLSAIGIKNFATDKILPIAYPERIDPFKQINFREKL